MKKLNRFFSISLTVAILASLLVTSAIPVSADDQAWSSIKVPTKTGLVMPNTITASGPMAQAIDGTLYAAITNSAETVTTTRLAKSTDGGRNWTSIAVTQGAITAIAVSPSEANVVYFSVGADLFRSTDSGATYTSRGTAGGAISAIGAALVGGSYKVFVGTPAGVFFQNEGDLFPVFPAVAFLNTGGANVLALKLSPSFATDLGIVIVTKAGGFAPVASMSVGGSNFNTTLKNVDIGAATDTTVASIGMPNNFNGVSSPFLYVGIDGAAGGVYRVMGSTTISSTLFLPGVTLGTPVVSIDVLGAFAGATVIAGTSNLKVYTSTDGGIAFTAAKKLTGPAAGMTFVALKSDFATSGTAYALVGGAGLAANDQSGFNVSVDQGKNFNQVSLLNDSWTAINDMATNATTTWLATSRTIAASGGTAAGFFTATGNSTGGTPIAADALVITGPTGAGTTATATFTISTGTATAAITTQTTGSASVVGGVIFLGVADVATITATSNGTSGSVNVQGSGAATVTMAVTDADTIDDAVVVPPAAFPGVASFSLPDAASATAVVVAGSIDLTITAGSVIVTGAATGNGTYTVGGPFTVTMTTANPTATITQTGAVVATGTFALTTATATVASPFSLAVAIGAGTTAYANSIWRLIGSNWERVRFSTDAAAINILQLSPNYATDTTVALTTKGSAAALMVSNNAGTLFTAQLAVPGGTVPAVVNAMAILDKNTFVVGSNAGVMTKTGDNGFTWANVTIGGTTPGNVTSMARSSDGTALVVGTDAGKLSLSTDLGATWSTATASVAAASLMVTFQNASTSVVWGTPATGGLYSYNFAATTPAWSTSRQDDGVALFNSAAGDLLTTPVGIASGSSVTYGLNGTGGTVVRLLSDASKAGIIAAGADFTIAQALFINGNKLTIIGDSKELWTWTDTLAVAVGGVAIGSTTTTGTTSTAVVNWTALAPLDRFAVAVKAGSSAEKDLYTAALAVSGQSGTTYTLTGLASNTTYTVSVWGHRATVGTADAFNTATLAGTVTFSTPPEAVGAPPVLAPAAGSTGISTVPGFQWGPVTGATSYELEVSTSPTYTPLVGAKITTTISAYAWTTPALANNTTYYWRVRAITATGTSAYQIGVFTTVAAVTTQPTQAPPTFTFTNTTIAPAATPAYIWVIIGIGAILVILIIVLIVRTRRTV